MPVPFRQDASVERLGTAAFLRIEAESTGFRGALLLVDARGEPVEFAYNRIEVAQRFLWGDGQLKRHASRRLAATLLEICPRVPSLLLCKAEEVESEVFVEDIRLTLPVARVADDGAVIGLAAGEESEDSSGSQLFWAGAQPTAGSTERALLDELSRRGFLREPFERAASGLREVYGDPDLVD